ncbi:MAG: ankyrin repeat domain-containing protein [Candidatus Marinimicrobia bacterium]|jgi:ankyrin repeat protein|nr:ankyrin repeat domain-containing protein [Candidatus Neomarinimicrobiota bacterium]MBT4129811.1 ankyrin repeat domain-containing protein [Candidatus Neomarinimicrobiota bacterium]MBT4294517.1 ankyrin repeat domain-containing protein [Candidatus Neomarinimicrobiota bacterium]MBT4420984.1 ankyrin repeat domain-containing protein [Candidatus Neomarinimicrobiota bacterium]MBT4992119.1 ankyrin repeat domain-containing protein [Candidatus Neomarinimicrobiota bacterium]
MTLITNLNSMATPSERLWHAIAAKDFAKVKLSMDKGADANAHLMCGTSVLMHAIQIGQFDIAKFLVRKGADVNAKTIDPFTVLMYAVSTGDLSMVKCLVGEGADTTVLSGGDQPMTALGLAVKFNRVDIEVYLESR